MMLISKLLMARATSEEPGAGQVEFVSGVAPTITNNATVNYNLPAGLAEDDLVLVGLAADSAGSSINTAGYNLLFSTGTTDPSGGVYGKVMGATPDTQVNITATWGPGVTITAFRNVDPAALASLSITSVAGIGTNYDPPANTSDIDGSMHVLFAFVDDKIVTAATPPAGFSNQFIGPGSGSEGTTASVITASQFLPSAGALNPNAFACAFNDAFVVAHIVFPPAGSPNVVIPSAAIFSTVDYGPYTATGATGNLYDIAATVTFTHASAANIVTRMYYTGSGTSFKFRFTPTALGLWSYTTSSAQAALNGLSGTLNATAAPTARGFLIPTGASNTKWGRQIGDGTVEAIDMPLLMATFYLERFVSDATAQAAGYANLNAAIQAAFIDLPNNHGMRGVHIPSIARRFWSLAGTASHEGSALSGTELNPLPNAFLALENIITRCHAAGKVVMMWGFGDIKRTQSPTLLSGGQNGTVHNRMMRYMAARLGPLPGWFFGYGYDPEEWTSPAAVTTMRNYYKSQTTYPTFIGCRSDYVNVGDLLSTGDQAWFGIGDYDDACQHIDDTPDIFQTWNDLLVKVDGDRPIMSGDRFRVTQAAAIVPGAADSTGGGTDGAGNPGKDWTVDQTVRGMHLANIYGGVAAIWGRLHSSPSTIGWEGSVNYPTTTRTQMATYRTFWDLHFSASLVPANSRVSSANSAACGSSTKTIACRTLASSITLNLPDSSWLGATITYVNTAVAYATVSGGTVASITQTLTFPSSSTWLVVIQK